MFSLRSSKHPAHVSRRLVVIGSALALQVAVTVVSLDLLSAVRAFVTGESLYSKGQKDAYFHLEAFSRTRAPEAFASFREAIGVPIAYRHARLALLGPDRDEVAGRRALVAGGTEPDDVQSVVTLVRFFGRTRLLERPIALWTEGDAAVAELERLGIEVRDALGDTTGGEARLRTAMGRANELNGRLTELETAFSRSLGRSARIGEAALVVVNVALAIALFGIGAAVVRREQQRETLWRRREIELVATRAAFLSKVSHELRSPLQSMVSALDVFELRHRDAARGDAELISRMRRASLLLNTQLRDLLTLARGEAGRLQIVPETVDAVELVGAMAEAARPLAESRGLTLHVDAPDEPVFVVADGARIDQVLTNLVVNSLRYTDEGTVRVALLPVEPHDRHVRFVVADTGRGIPEEALPSLLWPERGGTSTARRGEGSGIGLAIVRILVEQLAGTIRVTSRVGEGTRFEVEIPVERPAD